jgi:hypothetical protein
MVDSEEGRVVNPDGRFFQWRARFVGAQDGGPRLSAFRVTYEPYNRSPRILEFQAVDGREAFSAEAVFSWVVEDPDGDPLELRLERRGGSGSAWIAAARADAGGAGAKRAAGTLSWDTRSTEEGRYELRAVATDRAANSAEEGRDARLSFPFSVTVDRTPPELRVRSLDGAAVEIDLADRLSTIRRLEVLREGETLYSARPLDGVCDTREERFRVELPGDGARWSVRGADAAGNAVEEDLRGP